MKGLLNLPSFFLLLTLIHIIKGEGDTCDKKELKKKEYGTFEVDPNVIFPMVTLPLGQLRGKALKSRTGKNYYTYRGIPYAERPQRFKPPVPVKPWEGIKDARENGAVCAQTNIFTGQFDGSEDCLFLNIDFPHQERCLNESSNGYLPVMFHVHGGSFSATSGSEFGGEYLLDECVVYVSINYRLGVVGFLTTGDDVIPGNLGMKDTVLALQWTRQYISYFRGDPELVTVMGISSGGFAVSHLVTSPMAKGLFSRAISQSGTTISQWSIQRLPLNHANAFGLRLNCPIESSTVLRECIEMKDIQEIIANQADGQPIPFGITIEPKNAVAPFQTENPAILLQNGDFNQVPIIAGFTENEGITLLAGMILLDPNKTEELNNSWEEMAPKYFMYDDLSLDQTEKNRISGEIRQFYFGSESIGEGTRQSLVNLFSDRNFIQGTFVSVELHSKFAPAYPYAMTYKGGFSSGSTVGYEVPTSGHADDAQYLYVAWEQFFSKFTPGTEQYKFSRQFITHWVHFAKTGEPYTFVDQAPWKPVNGIGNANWHKLDIVEENLINYLDDRRTFWQNLGLIQHEMTLTP